MPISWRIFHSLLWSTLSKAFGVVNKAEVDVFLELSCFFNDPMDVGNLISGSSAISKSSFRAKKGGNNSITNPGNGVIPCTHHPFVNKPWLNYPNLSEPPVKNEWVIVTFENLCFLVFYTALWNQLIQKTAATSLVVQQLRFHAPNAGGLGSISGQGSRSHRPQPRPGAAKWIIFEKWQVHPNSWIHPLLLGKEHQNSNVVHLDKPMNKLSAFTSNNSLLGLLVS